MKKYALLMMLLVGFLVPMTIASKNLEFKTIESLIDNQELFIGVELNRGIDTRNQAVLAWEEVTTQKIRCSEYQAVLAVGSGTDRRPTGEQVKFSIFDRVVRYQVDSLNGLEVNIYRGDNKVPYIYNDPGINLLCNTNYIRYLSREPFLAERQAITKIIDVNNKIKGGAVFTAYI